MNSSYGNDSGFTKLGTTELVQVNGGKGMGSSGGSSISSGPGPGVTVTTTPAKDGFVVNGNGVGYQSGNTTVTVGGSTDGTLAGSSASVSVSRSK